MELSSRVLAAWLRESSSSSYRASLVRLLQHDRILLDRVLDGNAGHLADVCRLMAGGVAVAAGFSGKGQPKSPVA